MIVKCIANTGEGLSQIKFDLGYSKESRFNIELEKIYIVYGISMWKNSLEYLISEVGTGNPLWCPAELFKVVSKSLPISWYFNFEKYKNYKGQDSEKAIWGYRELVENEDHYADLLQNTPEALEIFKNKKSQIDEYEGL